MGKYLSCYAHITYHPMVLYLNRINSLTICEKHFRIRFFIPCEYSMLILWERFRSFLTKYGTMYTWWASMCWKWNPLKFLISMVFFPAFVLSINIYNRHWWRHEKPMMMMCCILLHALYVIQTRFAMNMLWWPDQYYFDEHVFYHFQVMRSVPLKETEIADIGTLFGISMEYAFMLVPRNQSVIGHSTNLIVISI